MIYHKHNFLFFIRLTQTPSSKNTGDSASLTWNRYNGNTFIGDHTGGTAVLHIEMSSLKTLSVKEKRKINRLMV